VILAFVLGEYVNGAVIIALLLFNGIMSYHHDLSAQAQVEALKAKLRIEARVLR
jgi:H+-transporting ATPase